MSCRITISRIVRGSTFSSSRAAGELEVWSRTSVSYDGSASELPRPRSRPQCARARSCWARTELLEGLRATTHWQSLDRMDQAFPMVTVVRDQHVVEEGTILTSAGISAGIDMALRVVAKLHGEAIARATAQYMEYTYPEGECAAGLMWSRAGLP